jgi:hypothetical protein
MRRTALAAIQRLSSWQAGLGRSVVQFLGVLLPTTGRELIIRLATRCVFTEGVD